MSSSGELVDRGGVLLRTEQHPPVNPSENGEPDVTAQEKVAMLLAFVRGIMRTSTEDQVSLAIYSAAELTGHEPQTVATVLRSVTKHAGTSFPPGFM